MFAPLNVDCDLAAFAPIGMQQSAMPEGPYVGGRARGVVANPHDLLVGGDREWDPGAVDVISPQEMVGDDAAGGVYDGNDPLKGEPFVALDV